MRTPVAFMVFNRPDLTDRVFAEIARARPPKLLVIADGPRLDKTGEAEKCIATRAIIDRVDWKCDVLKNYSDTNLGCGRRPSSGLRWVFEQVKEAIVLEDDCFPHPTFFHFCDELLERYRDNEGVVHISGNNFTMAQKTIPYSYHFSCYPLSWGWATWRRAFQHYDPGIKLWPALRDTNWLPDILRDSRAVEHWKRIFDLTHANIDNVNTWDFQWVFTCWARRGLSILPSTNLVSNIGYREDATHTTNPGDNRAKAAIAEMIFPLKHPACILRDESNDQMIFEQVVLPPRPKASFYHKFRQKCLDMLPTPLRRSLSSLRALVEN